MRGAKRKESEKSWVFREKGVQRCRERCDQIDKPASEKGGTRLLREETRGSKEKWGAYELSKSPTQREEGSGTKKGGIIDGD